MVPKGKRIAVVAGVVVVGVLATAAWTFRGRLQAWYHFRKRFENLGVSEYGQLEFRHRKTGIVMVRIPGGTFVMGSPEDEVNHQDDEVQHQVRLSPFLIGKKELTQMEWKLETGSTTPDLKEEHLSVKSLSWNDCQEFCDANKLKLPTEAQWEYSCRAGSKGPYSDSGGLDDLGWYRQNSGSEKQHSAGKKKPNAFGLYDVHGNVWEWCQDFYDKDFYSQAEAGEKDPVCTDGSDDRIIRGGSYCDFASECRSAERRALPPSQSAANLGFRPAFYPLP